MPRSVYLHVPFCRHRCGYCNFSVVANRDDLMDRFVDCIATEIQSEMTRAGKPTVDTVFIGGGTPTHLPDPILARLLQVVRESFDLDPSYEFSVEANPEDIDDPTLDTLVEFGVNRISLGVQSFDNEKLAILERGHDGSQAAEVVAQAASRIANVSIDLIFATPGESLDTWQNDLQTATSLPIEHLSTYSLTYEKGTSFWNRRRQGELASLSDQDEIDQYRLAIQGAAEAGLAHYEVSNFASPGNRCRHNLAYWHGQGWYAAGPGAARFVAGKREVNHRSPTTYIKKVQNGESPIAESEQISMTQSARERFAFGMRLIDGVNVAQLGRETGVDLMSECCQSIDRMTELGWIVVRDGHAAMTEAGLLFADSIASEILSS